MILLSMDPTDPFRICVSGEDDGNGSEMVQTAESTFLQYGRCVLDLREMTYISAGFCRVLVAIFSKALRYRSSFALVVLPGSHVERVLNQVGIAGAMAVYPSFERKTEKAAL